MWLALAFVSAFLLGLYDVAKKSALTANAVLPVLFINTLVCTALFLPVIVLSARGSIDEQSVLHVPPGGLRDHILVAVKGVIVLSSWIAGYIGIKHLPITITGPITATRPVMVLIGALFVFGERLNGYQWAGVLLSLVSLFLLSNAGKREGIDFRSNRWIVLIFFAAVMGAVSALYDKFLMTHMAPMFVQSWFNIYQFALMVPVLGLLWLPARATSTPFTWRWSILMIPVLVCAADFIYFYALSYPDSLISVVSMVRHSCVVVSFAFGALIFREKNLRAKALDLLLIILGMVLLWIGSK